MDFSRYSAPSPQWRAFIAKHPNSEREGHSGNVISDAESLRTRENATREAAAKQVMASKDLNTRVEIATILIPSRASHSIPIRRYAPRDSPTSAQRVLLFFHGGGLLFGSETTDDVLCSNVALEQNATVLSVIYRHTPAHKHPAQHDDAWDAFQIVRAGARGLGLDITHGIGIMGISAGGGLAAGVVVRDLTQTWMSAGYKSIINGVVLSIPWLIHIDNYPFDKFACRNKAAKIQNADTPVVPAARLRLFSDILAAQDPTDPFLNVALTPDVGLLGWPKTAFLVAGMDPLRDDALLFASRLESTGYA